MAKKRQKCPTFPKSDFKNGTQKTGKNGEKTSKNGQKWPFLG